VIVRTPSQNARLLAAVKKELKRLDSRREEVIEEIESLQEERKLIDVTSSSFFRPRAPESQPHLNHLLMHQIDEGLHRYQHGLANLVGRRR